MKTGIIKDSVAGEIKNSKKGEIDDKDIIEINLKDLSKIPASYSKSTRGYDPNTMFCGKLKELQKLNNNSYNIPNSIYGFDLIGIAKVKGKGKIQFVEAVEEGVF